MRRTLLASFVLLILATSAPAAWDAAPRKGDPDRIARSRHYILTPERVLSEEEQAEMQTRGIEITRPLSAGRYLVRVAAGVAVDDSFERLTAEKKIHRAVLAAAAAGKPFIRIRAVFHDDVPFEAAQQVIAAAGGSVEDPLQLDFEEATSIAARIPSALLHTLASDERVLLVYGPERLRMTLHNANSARASDVDVVHQPPYNLTGEGVVLSFFEFAPADASHREFGGRLTTHLTGTSAGDIEHATHVAGTIIAGGVEATAKGMAPKATLHQFSARDGFLSRKENLPSFGVVADNNSWGYILGWCEPSKCTEWVWDAVDRTAELYGAYSIFETAPIDRITRSTGVLFFHSAGKDADKRGPQSAPFAHRHGDGLFDTQTGTYCYSQDGSGTDCPVPACSAGRQFCETVRHPQIIAELPAPYGSVGLTASAKNSVAVGALVTIGSERVIAAFSSQGPARDGRVKPDLVARGVSVVSTRQGNSYTTKSGTSMASPAVTGMAALVVEQWRSTFSGATPPPAMTKTLLIAGAEDLGNRGPDYSYGFGLANAQNSVDLIVADGGTGRRITRGALSQATTFEPTFRATAGQNVRVVLGWTDPEVVIFPSDGLATSTLVNDLDLRVITPAGETILPYVLDRTQPAEPATRGVNTVDNIEMLEFTAESSGRYRLVVTGKRITAQSPQEFALVANTEIAPPCLDFNEPNDTEATATRLAQGPAVSGRTCFEDDVDYFTFVVNEPGSVAVTVTATQTPLRVTLTSPATLASIDVAAGQSGTVSVPYNATTPTTFFVRVEPSGDIGADNAYTISATYPFDPGPRRRAAGR